MVPVQVKRRFERVPFHNRVTVIVLGTNLEIEAFTSDISLGGVGLNCCTYLRVGQVVSMDFHMKSRAGAVTERVFGQISHVRSDDDVVAVGVEFTEVLGPRVPYLTRTVENL